LDQATGRIVAEPTGSVSEANVDAFTDKPTVALGAESAGTIPQEAPPNTIDFAGASTPASPAAPPSAPREPVLVAPTQTAPPPARPSVTPRPQSRPTAAAHPGYAPQPRNNLSRSAALSR
jgi:hypothetical protein